MAATENDFKLALARKTMQLNGWGYDLEKLHLATHQDTESPGKNTLKVVVECRRSNCYVFGERAT